MADAPAPDVAPEPAQALTSANQNPWYVLATLHGEQPEGARPWELDTELHAKNRLAWNKWAAEALSEEKRRALGERRDGSGQPVYSEQELTPYTAEETAVLKRRWRREWTRRNPSLSLIPLPDPSQVVDCTSVHFERVVMWEGFIVSSNVLFGKAAFFGDAWFKEATFSGHARFEKTVFSGYTWFEHAVFSGDALFEKAAFSGYTRFEKAVFSGRAGFQKAAFSGDAEFKKVTFSDFAWFEKATFSGDAEFENTTFYRDIGFQNVTFSRDAGFENASCYGNARFEKTVFSGYARFENATFSRDAGFETVAFSRDAGFQNATFSADVRFENATFSRDAGFQSAAFSGDAGFQKVTFSRYAGFHNATFSGDAAFEDATFSGDAGFETAAFSGAAGFQKAAFSRDAGFQKAIFSGDVGFENAAFSGKARFGDARLQSSTSFVGARFGLHPPRFHGASLHEGTQWHGAQWPPAPDDAKDAQQHVYAYERLKQEMERLKKHDDELQFFEREMRCRRVVEDQHLPAERLKRVFSLLKGDGWSGLLNRAYDCFSGYGRSILRPTLGLVATFVLGIAAMMQAACWPARAGSCPAILTLDSPFIALKQATLLSFANMLAPLNVRKDFFDADMLAGLSGWLKIVGGLQTLLALGFAFLIGLALRNRFRLR